MRRLFWMGWLCACLAGVPVYAEPPSEAQSGAETDLAAASSEGGEEASVAEGAGDVYADLKPRDVYNLALDFLNKGEFDKAIEGFSRARDVAAYDNELRYSAAYNLAHGYAQRASSLGEMSSLDEASLQSMIDDLQLSEAWFRDAVRQRPSLDEARGNLEIVIKRLLAAKDVLSQKFRTLDRQLDEVIATERGIRESARVLSERLRSENAGRDPMAFQDDFRSMARAQREALTQANLVAENLANALAQIESKPEEARTQEDGFRMFQYQSATPLLESGRQAMAGARRQMRELSMESALRLTNKAFNLLKQAREQLDDPLRTLAHIAEDEQGFVRLAAARHLFETPELLEAYRVQTQNPDAELPAWLNDALLSDTQNDALERTNRLVSFLRAVVESAKSQPEPQVPEGTDPRKVEAAREQLAQMSEALPFIENAASAMQKATQTILTADRVNTIEHANQAVQQLELAMERFADLKHLIEIAYRMQSGISQIVRGTLDNTAADAANGEQPPSMTRAEQREALRPALDMNGGRLARLSDLLAKELAKMNQQATEAAQAAGQNGTDAQGEAQLAQIQQLFEEAERLRQTAFDATRRMETVVSGEPGLDETVRPEDPSQAEWTELTPDAQEAQSSIESLRVLFFSVVEHVQELFRQQTATMDTTTDVASLSADAQAVRLPPVLDRQRVHEVTASQLADVLVQQAQQMSQQSQGQAAEMAQRYNQASSELQVAATAMRQAQTDLQNDGVLFTEALEQQRVALEHIQKALELLQPPQPQNPQSQQEQQPQQSQPQKMSKEQAEKKIQQIRSRDQERRKSRSQREGGGMPTVEKDW